MFKAGGTPKQLPSILEIWIIGLQLCVMYAGLLPGWMDTMSWITVLGIKPNVTRNVWNRRDRKRQRNHTRRSPISGDERRCPNYPAQMSPTPSVWSSWRTQVSSLSEYGSSQLHFSGESSLNQTNCYFFLQSQCVWCNGAYVNCFILCFNFNMLK